MKYLKGSIGHVVWIFSQLHSWCDNATVGHPWKIPWFSLDLKALLFLCLFFFPPRIITLCRFSSTMEKDHFFVIFYGTGWPLCANVPLNPHSFIYWTMRKCTKQITAKCNILGLSYYIVPLGISNYTLQIETDQIRLK